MTKKNKLILAVACLTELLVSFIVWMLKVEFTQANRITCALFIGYYAVAVVLLLCGFFLSKTIFFKLCAIIPVLFCGQYCFMQLIGGGFVALFNEIYLPRFVVFVLSVALCVFVAVFSKKARTA